MAQRSAIVNVMMNAATKAGRGLRRAFGEVETLQISKKGPADFVSEADRRAEKTIFDELQKARPRYGFLMEEEGALEGPDDSNRWIIDPLDGTLNFLHGLPHFCISIALERDRELFAGIIYEPLTDQMFWAEKGSGAFLNSKRIRVSGRQDTHEALFATGIPFLGREGHEEFIGQLKSVMAVSAGVRRCGSAALDLAYLAAGRFDGFWEHGLNPWDMAAGIVMIREAGGFVSDFQGKDRMLDTGEIVAGNSHMFDVLKKLISSP